MKPKKNFTKFAELKTHLIQELKTPIINPDNYSENLQTDDILLFSGKYSLSRRVKIMSSLYLKRRTLWNHAAMVIKLQNPDVVNQNDTPLSRKLQTPQYFIIESIGIGVRIIHLEIVLKNYENQKGYNGDIIIVRHEKLLDKTQSNAQLNTIFHFAIAALNTPFDNLDIIKLTWRSIMRMFKRDYSKSLSPLPPYVCTELVFHSYREASIPLNHTSGMITAEDIWQDDNLHAIGILGI